MEVDADGPAVEMNHPRNIEKRRAVISAAAEGVGQMSTADAINLAGEVLDKLGIKE